MLFRRGARAEGAEIANIVAEAAPLRPLDAAYALWRRRDRLDTLEGRPTAEAHAVARARQDYPGFRESTCQQHDVAYYYK